MRYIMNSIQHHGLRTGVDAQKHERLPVTLIFLSFLLISCDIINKEKISILFDKEPILIMECEINFIPASKNFSLWRGYTIKDGRKSLTKNVFEWRRPDGKKITFIGSGSVDGPGWWFGTINGQSAAGYNLNRGHHVFSTSNGKFDFRCWRDEFKHGDY
jgi:hypothetical protein